MTQRIAVLFFLTAVSSVVAQSPNTGDVVYQPAEPRSVHQNKFGAKDSVSTVVPPNFLSAINIAELQAAAQAMCTATGEKISIIVIDSGINTSAVSLPIDKIWSKSWTGDDPMIDLVGHGSTVASDQNVILNNGCVKFVSLQVIQPTATPVPGISGYGTTADFISALEYVMKKIPGKKVVNASLVGYPDSPDLQRALADLEKVAFVALAAGNDNIPIATNPCVYAHQTTHEMCLGAVNLDGSKAEASNYGATVEMASYDQWTSFATAQVSAVAALLLQLGDFSPALLKSLVLHWSTYDPLIAGMIGNYAEQLDGRVLNGDGAKQGLQSLQTIEVFEVEPAEVHPGDSVVITINRFLWGNVGVQLTDLLGNISITSGKVVANQITFEAPRDGVYKAQVAVEGVPFGQTIDLVVTSSVLRHPTNVPTSRKGRGPISHSSSN